MLSDLPALCSRDYLIGPGMDSGVLVSRLAHPVLDRPSASPSADAPASGHCANRANLHITNDHGGYVEEDKATDPRPARAVIIDGVCNSACTLVFGIVPPRARIGFHKAYYDKPFTFGVNVTSLEGTAELMSYYPNSVQDRIRRNGGLTTQMRKIRNEVELWKIVDPCPEEY